MISPQLLPSSYLVFVCISEPPRGNWELQGVEFGKMRRLGRDDVMLAAASRSAQCGDGSPVSLAALEEVTLA